MTVPWPNTVTIGPFAADNDTTDFRVTALLTGWDDAAPVRTAIADRDQQDGAWDAMPFTGARVVTVEGVVDQPSAAAAMAVKDALTALAPRTMHGLEVVNDSVGVRCAAVRVSQGAVIEWVAPECFTYTLQLVAPDPLKYGPVVFDSAGLAVGGVGIGWVWPTAWPLDWGVAPGETPGAVFLPNNGAEGYYPLLRIDGPVTNATVTVAGTGDFLHLNRALGTGQFVTVDCAARRVLLQDQVSLRLEVESSARFPSIPPGGAWLSWTADAAYPTALLSVWGREGAHP